MGIVRYRFISPVGDDQEHFYEQKYLLSTPISIGDSILSNPPDSWLEHCVSIGMCDVHTDCLTSLQSAISRGFDIEAIRQLAHIH